MSRDLVIVIEDDNETSALIKSSLTRASYDVEIAGSAREGIAMLKERQPCLLLLDLMLPDQDGLELFKSIKKNSATEAIPVIMITARDEEADIVSGLELGADDYITKPFSPRVLAARVKSVLRRSLQEEVSDDAIIKIDNLVIHPGQHDVQVDGKKVSLTLTEFKILHLMARKPGWVFTRRQMVDVTRGHGEEEVNERSIDVVIVGLRKKLGVADRLIETVRGVGYKIQQNES